MTGSVRLVRGRGSKPAPAPTIVAPSDEIGLQAARGQEANCTANSSERGSARRKVLDGADLERVVVLGKLKQPSPEVANHHEHALHCARL